MTKTEALETVFSRPGLSDTMRYRKHLFKAGELSERKATQTLEEFDYERVKEEIWKRKSSTNKKDKPKK